MSDNINPYESTQTNVGDQMPLIPQGHFTALSIIYLRAASPWMKFMGIISFVGAGISILIGMGILLMIPIFRNGINFPATFFAGLINSFWGFFYIAYGVIWIFPSKYLYNFAAKIKLFLEMKDERVMESALRNNKSFWKFHGILIIISLAFIPLMFVISIFLAITSFVM